MSLVFSTTVRMEDLNFGPQLGVALCLIVFVGLEGVGFLCKEVKIGEPGLVIDEGHIITLSALRSNWCGSPKIRMYLCSSALFPSLSFATDFLVAFAYTQDSQKNGSPDSVSARRTPMTSLLSMSFLAIRGEM